MKEVGRGMSGGHRAETEAAAASGPLGPFGRERLRHRPTFWRALALLLALAVFSIDTFTSVHGAIAVLYVLVLLLAADSLSRRGLLLAGAACALLALLSLVVAHGSEIDFGAALRCSTALAAIAITTALLLRTHSAKRLLIDANRALARSEERYRSIFEQASVSLWELDFSALRERLATLRGEGVVDLARHAEANPGFLAECAALIRAVDVNRSALQLLGADSRRDVLGPVGRFLDGGRPAFFKVVQAVFEGWPQVEGKSPLIRLDGSRIVVLFGLNLPAEPQAYDRVVVSVLDVTRSEETQEALMAAQAELARATRIATLGALSASIAHELNQPLGALVMNVQTCLRWLRREPPDLESAIRAAERGVGDGKRASEILQRTRAMLVKKERRDEAVDLREVVRDAELLLERELTKAGARVVTQVAGELPPVPGDRVELQQVLVNLLSNGLHAMEEAVAPLRELTVELACSEEEARVTVRDRGPGIAEADLARLFEPFFTTRIGGMGMGLAICRSLIEARGGRLTAANHEEGGAVFRFTLPVADPPPAAGGGP